MPLQAVESQRLYRQIADQLRALITGGEFPAGTRLPAERDLAKQLGVSRPSVREALIALEVEGWVEVRVGSGIYAQAQPADAAPPAPAAEPALLGSADWGPLELMQARELVEAEVAALAAKHARRADIAAIQAGLDRMREQADSGQMPAEGDQDFHAAIANACGNEVLRDTVRGYWQARQGPLFARMSEYFEHPQSWVAALAEHAQVLDAIRSKDPAAARAAMQMHLRKATRRYSANWRRAPSP